MCHAEWLDRMVFLRDASLEIIGYQANFDNLKLGLIYFTHRVDGCFSTMTIKAEEFFDLNPNKQYAIRKTLTEECPQYCLHIDNFEKCDAKCECAYVRDLLLIMQSIKRGAKDERVKNTTAPDE